MNSVLEKCYNIFLSDMSFAEIFVVSARFWRRQRLRIIQVKYWSWCPVFIDLSHCVVKHDLSLNNIELLVRMFLSAQNRFSEIQCIYIYLITSELAGRHATNENALGKASPFWPLKLVLDSAKLSLAGSCLQRNGSATDINKRNQ